ncbi:3-hydroxyacyl-CoA dehydrogenase family protein [Nocardiopsis sp. MT53]|uniref:3-hydroxyacyl-CoA dehydrogenase family protein n=2 Tax=Nocardiopsis changdeensis TaxID=2831969 RepID=A0ABX8BUQ1_9ACTN|nr:3-hydroxyacyl-CoA dehydrogenase family protein [Nocardiopsis sp. MT53]QUX25939.1 3-hydroxyacyl-CoA dehydrogenase family protein [Nocardiopsis changdeensis]QYX40411.1 3-hydroxyacyl-CoA dehydrogenase family protein [Nocardiopsis sp. MT53]
MGAGIVQQFLTAGASVTLVEATAEAAGAGRDRVASGLAASAARGKLDGEPDAYLARLSTATDAADIPAGTGLVVEAVPERPELKIAVLTAAEAAVGEEAVLASNTSSLSVTELAAALKHPRRFLGTHFFNPVPASKLVEIVTAPDTDPAVTAAVRGWVAALGKTEIVVRDAPGFATSRLGVMLGLEAIRMVEEEVASPADIDTAMELGYRHPMGPLRLTDLVGLDVRLAIAEYLAAELGDRFSPPELLRRMVAEGKLGKKTGQGFHTWNKGE